MRSYIPTNLRWCADKYRRVAFGVAPKCGLHSIWEALKTDDIHVHVNPYECERRVFIVRHPLSRFESLWKNMCRDGEQPGIGISGMSPEGLFEHIQVAENYHWTPQVKLLNGVDSEVVRLENMGEWWMDYCGREYPKLHATEGEAILSDELRDKVLNYYAEDLRLWNGV